MYRYVETNACRSDFTVRRFRESVREARTKAGLSVCEITGTERQTLTLRGTKRKYRKVLILSGEEVVGEIRELDDEERTKRRRPDNERFAVSYKSVQGYFCLAYQRSDETYCFTTVAAAKRHAEARLEDFLQEDRERYGKKQTRSVPVTMLPSGDGTEFYPTPMSVAGRMVGKIDWEHVYTVLEPSAGKGNLLDALNARLRHNHRNDNRLDVDCLEVDDNLRAILKDNGWRVVGEDFFDYSTVKKYDAVLMNPPFSEGDKHLLRAISLLERNGGGQIVCLLNENTIKNPYSRSRKELQRKLDKYGAQYEYLRGAFRKAERQTDVDTVIVWLTVPEPPVRSRIMDYLKKARAETESGPLTREVARRGTNWIEQMVMDFEMDAAATIRFLREYEGIRGHLHGLYLNIDGTKTDAITSYTINRQLKEVREHYWRKLLNDSRFAMVVGKMTSTMRDEYDRNITVFSNCDFSRDNIKLLVNEIQGQLNMGLKAEMLKLFDTFTSYDLRHDSDHIHYYNGWKTNKCYKVGKKVIVPMYTAFLTWAKDDDLREYEVQSFLDNIQKVLDFLDRGQTSWSPTLLEKIRLANSQSGFKKVETHYFWATFYKKGTCHIVFKPDMMHVVDRLNIFAAMKKTWLPPYYGKVRYEDMDAEGKAVIDGFHGDKPDPQAEYAKVVKDPGNYITRVESSLPLLTSGEGGVA